MPIDERQFEINDIMMNQVPEEIRGSYEAMVESNNTFGITIREHKFWFAQYVIPTLNGSMIEGTAFKPPAWSPAYIKHKREKKTIRRRG